MKTSSGSHQFKLYDDHIQHYSQPGLKLELLKGWKRFYEEIHQTPEGFFSSIIIYLFYVGNVQIIV